MLGLPWFSARRRKLDRKILRKNDISLLILDERWNKLFVNTQKTPRIASCEEKLKELLKEEARLNTEAAEIATEKKKHMDRIIKLTPAVFEQNDEEAKKEMDSCQKEIRRINDRIPKIKEALDGMPDRIKAANLELLENTVGIVYFKIRSGRKRVEELEKLIEETRERLKQYIDEKESLSQDDNDIYSYFHDLLGGEELEKLDNEFFGKRRKG